MPRKKKTKPTLKIGQCVRLNPESKRFKHYEPYIGGRIVKIIRINYHEIFENNPSPWSLDFEGVDNSEWDIFEEDVILDPFMTAAHEAVNSEKEKEDDRKNQKARVTRRRKGQPSQAQGDRRRSIRQVS